MLRIAPAFGQANSLVEIIARSDFRLRSKISLTSSAPSSFVPALDESAAKEKSGVARIQYALPAGTGAASAAFYRGMLMPVFRDNLFVAAEAGRHVIRLQFDPGSPERIVSTERLMEDQLGPVRVIAVGPDEALYIANDSALFRLAP